MLPKILPSPFFLSGELLCILGGPTLMVPGWEDIRYPPGSPAALCTFWTINCSIHLEIFSLPVCFRPLSSCRAGAASYSPGPHQCCQQYFGHSKHSICLWNGVNERSGTLRGIQHFQVCLIIFSRAVGLKVELREAQILSFWLEWVWAVLWADSTIGYSVFVFAPELA